MLLFFGGGKSLEVGTSVLCGGPGCACFANSVVLYFIALYFPQWYLIAFEYPITFFRGHRKFLLKGGAPYFKHKKIFGNIPFNHIKSEHLLSSYCHPDHLAQTDSCYCVQEGHYLNLAWLLSSGLRWVTCLHSSYKGDWECERMDFRLHSCGWSLLIIQVSRKSPRYMRVRIRDRQRNVAKGHQAYELVPSVSHPAHSPH